MQETASSSRRQINVRVEKDVLAAIERLRQSTSPIPSISDVVRDAILEKESRDLSKKGRK